MEYKELREMVFNVAKEMSQRGRGWAQQSGVLREVAIRLPANTPDDGIEQQILTCWHDLFRIGRLSWGYNIDNPDAPFFHIPQADPQRDKVA